MTTEIMDFRKELGKISPKAKNGAKICFFGTGMHFEYLRKIYRCFAKINLEDFADCFVDNDINKQGKPFYGKPVISPNELTPDNTVVMICCIANLEPYEIQKQMIDIGFLFKSNLFGVMYMTAILKAWIFECFMRLKNKHLDERCFIIGNGSSLRPDDLDKLMGENTFAMNKIFKIFDKTKWRPTYYTCDGMMLAVEHEIINTQYNVKFLNFADVHKLAKKSDMTFDNTYYFSSHNLILERPVIYPCLFGEWPDLFFAGGTSTYLCLQLATFMGFNRIYLLGVDNTNSAMRNNSGEIVFRKDNCYFTSDYHERKELFSMNTERTNSSYQVAREYCEPRGIKIYNASRGGELEVFERVDFDSLF